jgi:hypothetical protein
MPCRTLKTNLLLSEEKMTIETPFKTGNEQLREHEKKMQENNKKS